MCAACWKKSTMSIPPRMQSGAAAALRKIPTTRIVILFGCVKDNVSPCTTYTLLGINAHNYT